MVFFALNFANFHLHIDPLTWQENHIFRLVTVKYLKSRDLALPRGLLLRNFDFLHPSDSWFDEFAC